MILAATLAVAFAAPAEARSGCNSTKCVERVKAKAEQRHYENIWRAAPRATRNHLRRISRCETGGTNNERIVSPGGRYRGLLQFSFASWAAVGGKGDPTAATRMEQWARGVRLYRVGGPGHWPVCQHA